MTIKVAVENWDHLRLIVYRYSGHISIADVLDSVTRATSQIAPAQPYNEVLIFEHDTDLSDFHPELLEGIIHKCRGLYAKLMLGPRTAVAVLDESLDAKIIMPLFNALALTGSGADLSFQLFTDIEPALQRLGIPKEEGLEIIARVA